MKANHCSQIARLLPLHAGGDLSGREGAQVEAHLATCTVCRAELTELRESGAWLMRLAASAPSFADAQLVEMRAAVLAEAHRNEQRVACDWRTTFTQAHRRWRWMPHFALAAAALLLMFATAFIITRQRSPLPQQAQYGKRQRPTPAAAERAGETKRTPDATIALAQDARRKTTPRFRKMQVAHAPSPVSVAPRPALPAPPPSELIASSDSAAEQEMLRIEIQTADPNIRIIWLASSAEDASLHPPTIK